jgi:hypothetical protein
MLHEWLIMFKVQGMDAWWLPFSPTNRGSRCDRCDFAVGKAQPRMRIANSLGPKRKGGHGHKHQYLCLSCARRAYGQRPPDYPYVPPPDAEEPPDQGTLL